MSELGQRFKAEREKRGISIQEIGLSLKISSRVITAIESGQRELLPARTFLRGFVKSYAQFLRIDVKETMDLFQKEYGVNDHSGVVKDVTATNDPEAPKNNGESASPVAVNAPTSRGYSEGPSLAKENIQGQTKFPIGKILIGIILFVAVIVLAKLVDKYQKERILPENETAISTPTDHDDEAPEDAGIEGATGILGIGTLSTANATSGSTGALSSTGTAVHASTPTSTPVPSPSSTPSPTATPKMTPTATPTPAATPSPTPKASPTPTATPSPTPTPTPTPKPSPTATPTPKPSPSPTASPIVKGKEDLGRVLEVMVETSKAVRIRYDLGNGKQTTLDLAEGEFHTFRSRSPIALDISDGGALNLIVNGRDRGKPGTSGNPVQLRIRE